MPYFSIAIEYKDRHLTRPMLDQIVGAALRSRPEIEEVIIRCRTMAKTAKKAAEDICKESTIRNGQGRMVRVTLAPDAALRGG